MKVERHLVRGGELRLDERHIPVLRPTAQFASVVAVEACESAARDYALDSGVECGGEEAVVAAQGVADCADPAAVHLRQGLEEIDSPHVVPYGLHGAAGPTA